MAKKKQKITVKKVAPIIAKNISSSDEVKINETGPGSLAEQVARDLKCKCDSELNRRLRYLWEQCDLRSEVESLMKTREDGSELTGNDESLVGNVHAPYNISLSPKSATSKGNETCTRKPMVYVGKTKYEIVNVRGDGNCLFRCFSHSLFGCEKSHSTIRQSIVKYTVDNWTEEVGMLNSTCPDKNYKHSNDYVKDMSLDTQYGTDFEIGVFVRLYKKNVTIYREISNGEIIKLHTLTCDEKNECNPLNIMFTGEERSGHWVVLEAVHDLPTTQYNEVSDIVEEENSTDIVYSCSFSPSTTFEHSDAESITPKTMMKVENVEVGKTSTLQHVDETKRNESPLNVKKVITLEQVEKVKETDESRHSEIVDTVEHVGKCSVQTSTVPRAVEEQMDDLVSLSSQKSGNEPTNMPAVKNVDSCSRPKRLTFYKNSYISKVNDKSDVFSFSEGASESSDVDSMYSSSAGMGQSRKRKRNESAVKSSVKTERKEHFAIDIDAIPIVSADLKDKLGRIDKEEIRNAISEVMLKKIGCTCTLTFYGELRYNERDIVAYAQCKRPDHKQKFKFRVNNVHKPVAEIAISSDAKIKYVHKKNVDAEVFVQIRGSKRKQTVEKLQNRRAIDYVDDLQLSTDQALKNDGHNQNLARLNTVQKVISDDKCKNSLCLESRDLSDLFQLKVNNDERIDPFVRYVTLPLGVYMYTLEDVYIVVKEKLLIIHFDATGSICRKPDHYNCKRIFYYSLVVKLEVELLRVGQLISCEHGVDAIGGFLRKFRKFVEGEMKKWPLANAVVVDWSWALIISILQEWNGMDVSSYLDITYECCLTGKDLMKDKTLIKICFGHFMKIVSKTIDDTYPQYEDFKDFKQLLLECMALLCLRRTLNEFTNVFRNLCKLLLSKHTPKDCLAVLRNLTNKESSTVRNIKDFDNVEVDDEIHSTKNAKNDAMYRKSPYYKKYSKIMTLIQVEIERQEEKNEMDGVAETLNEYYAPEFMEHVLTTWIPYLIFWSSIDLNVLDPGISRVSNAYSESSHRVLKEVILENLTHLSVADVVRRLDIRRQRTMGIIKLNANVKGTKRSRQKRKYPQTADDPLVEESWGKKKYRKKSYKGYISGRVVNALYSEAEQNVVRRLDIRRQRTMGIIKLNANVKGTKRSRQKRKYPQTADDPLVEESWGKKKYRKKSYKRYISGRVVNALYSEAEQKREEEETQEKECGEEQKTENIEKECSLCEGDEVDLSLECSEVEDIGDGESNETQVVLEENANDTEVLYQEEKFYNGLMKNVSYYGKSSSGFLTVCRHRTSKSLTVETFQMTTREFSSLRPRRWINGIAIDAFVASNIDDWSDVMFVPTDDTKIMLVESRRTDSRNICTTRKLINGKLIMPYLLIDHWWLLVADIPQRTLVLLDPYGGDDDKDRVVKAFKDFVSERSKESSKGTSFYNLKDVCWTVNDVVERPYQPSKDGYSCGVFVMYYAECLGSGKPFDMEFNPEIYRAEIAHNLLLKSEDMDQVCLHCFAPLKYDAAKCKICKRISHQACVFKSELDTEDEEKLTKVGHKKKRQTKVDYFVCKLCRASEKKSSKN